MEQLKRRKKSGRPKVKDKVKLAYLYLRNSEKKKIEDKFGTVHDAVISVVLPQCG